MNTVPPMMAMSGANNAPTLTQMTRFEAEKKSAGVALFLCWVLGGFGAHRFYMRRPLGVLMLIITLLSIPLCVVLIGFIGLFAVWVWVIADLFSVSRWAREYNTSLLMKIQSGQG